MKINPIQNISFKTIKPELKQEIIAERKKFTNSTEELKCFENSLKYLEYNDLFELKKSNKKGCYRLEFTSPFVHEGPIEHFIKPEITKGIEFTDPVAYRIYKKFAEIYKNNFANKTFEPLSEALSISRTFKGYYLKSQDDL